MSDMDSLAKTLELIGNYKERFKDAGIPKDLWYITEDMQCQNILYSFPARGTGEIIEDRCRKLLRDHPRTEEYLSAHGYQFYDVETGEMKRVKLADFCRCDVIIQQKQLIDRYDTIRRYRDANLPQMVRGQKQRTSLNATFENFTERAGAEAAFEIASDYTVGNAPSILVFIGGTGTGKTHLLEAIGRQYLEQEHESGAPYTVRYELVSNMLRLLRESFRIEAEESVLAHAYKADLLLLDDIGAEKPSEWVEQELFNLIEDRYRNNRLLVVATNEVEPTIKAKLGDRIASRLFDSETGTVKQVYLTATDYRAGVLS
jgi:DNA replication protein DnaC